MIITAPAARPVPVHALVVGDSVIDASGAAHRVTDLKVTGRKGEETVWIQRDDRPRVWEPIGFLDEGTVVVSPTWAGRHV
jgi:hypothetical protein